MKKLLLTFFILMNLAPAFAYAQTAQTAQTPTAFCGTGQNGNAGITCTYTPLEPLPGQLQNGGTLTFAQYVGNLFTISIVIGAMLAVAVFVFSGITYMVSEALSQKDWARRKLKQALWALLILLGSYLILSTINPTLVTFGGVLTSPINPLNNNSFIKQSPNGTAASGSSNTATLPSAAQINALPACTTTLTYGANGTPTCQGF